MHAFKSLRLHPPRRGAKWIIIGGRWPRPEASLLTRFSLSLAALLLIVGCNTRTVTRSNAVSMPPPMVSEEILAGPLVPETLGDRLAVVDYHFVAAPDPQVLLTVQNLSAEAPATLELRALFVDDENRLRFETDWTRVELAPGKRHHYFAQASDGGVTQGRALMREVLSAPATEPQAAEPQAAEAALTEVEPETP